MKEIKIDELIKLPDDQLKAYLGSLTQEELENFVWQKELDKVKKDPYYWLINYVYTFDPNNSENPICKFPDKEYLKIATDIWLRERILCVDKSAQMMCSWLFSALHTWDCLYHGGRYAIFQSQKQSKSGFGGGGDMKDVDSKGSGLSLLSRVDRIYSYLPIQLKPPMAFSKEPPIIRFIHKTNKGELISSINAVSSVGEEARGTTPSNVLGDEMGFQPDAEKTHTALAPRLTTNGKMTYVSTPNGKNYFFSMITDNLDTTKVDGMIVPKGVKIEKLMEGIYFWRNPKNRIAVLRIHYTADPDRRTAEWKEIKKQGMSESDWQKEEEIDYDIEGSYKGIFSKAFNPDVHIGDLRYNPAYPIYRGWDFGFHHPAVVFAQIIDGTIYVLRELMGTDIHTRDFILNEALPFGEIHFGKNAVYEDISDIAGSQKTGSAEYSDIEIMNALGIYPAYKKIYIQPRIKLTEILLNNQKIIIDMSCSLLTTGFAGGYKWDIDGKQPKKDEIYNHLTDGLLYIIYHLFNIPDAIRPPKEKEEIVLTPRQSIFKEAYLPQEEKEEINDDYLY